MHQIYTMVGGEISNEPGGGRKEGKLGRGCGEVKRSEVKGLN